MHTAAPMANDDPHPLATISRAQVVDAVVSRANEFTQGEVSLVIDRMIEFLRQARKNNGIVLIPKVGLSETVVRFIEGLLRPLKSLRPTVEQFLLQADPSGRRLEIRRKGAAYQLRIVGA